MGRGLSVRSFHLEGDVLLMPLDEGEVRFIEAELMGGGDGVAAVEFSVIRPAAIMTAAENHAAHLVR